ncbi:pseudouridine synthase [Burkholderia sp. ABCPW 14]|uniref:pseudouridine synthase n=1 Tax=Burkholderia sp. ABCPW 14 TaxID=1637860 RepID=UPI0012E3A5AB|nr:pseudouridine synthase [Burkholderia sp. ABCPW 14]
MRTKLTVKNPRPATPGRAPVRSGSLTARKVARPDAKAAGEKPIAPKSATRSAAKPAAKPSAPRGAATAAPKRAGTPSRPAAASEGKRVAKPRTADGAARPSGERTSARRAGAPGAAAGERARRTDTKSERRPAERGGQRDERPSRSTDARSFDPGARGKGRAERDTAKPADTRGAAGAKFGGAPRSPSRQSDDRAPRANGRTARDAAPSSFAGKGAAGGKRAPQRADDRYGAPAKRAPSRAAHSDERKAPRERTADDRRPAARATTGPALKVAQPIKRRATSSGESAAHVDRGDETGLVRLSKRMSELGLCSRREADEWIEKGWVLVDGERIDTLGTKVRADQRIEIDSNARAAQAAQVTILLHKPVGYVSGQAEDGYAPAATLVSRENHWSGDRSPLRFSPQHLRALAPAGRLDIDSTGLLVLTQNGRVAKQLIGEQSDIDKEYLVRVRFGERMADIDQHFPAESLAKLRHGLELDGAPLKPAMVSWQNGEQLRFVLREGKKRQIRRMCELVGLEVIGLKRVRMGRVMLGALPQGEWRYLGPDESF